MDDTLILLLVFVVLTALIFWPGRGLAQVWLRHRRNSSRVLAEDALKHVYNCAEARTVCTIESLAGALSLGKDRVVGLLDRLKEMKLVRYEGNGFKLTTDGKEYALRIIRVHRLWERYLADETTVRELDWHSEAEKKEHVLSQDETAALAKRLGHPPYDPHGDPIPTDFGTLPQPHGKPLYAFRVGDTIRVLHVEDEPAAIYAQVLRYELFPGVTAQIVHRTPDTIRIESGGKTLDVPTIVAANVRCGPASKTEVHRGTRKTLASLSLGDTGVVAGISMTCRGLQRRRLMDLGVVPGTVIEAEMRSAAGDPTSYRIRGASIALRRKQAELIYLEEERLS